VEAADRFYSTHNAGFTAYPYPKDLFLKFVKENHGYFPIKLEALPEGTVANIHVPVYQITAEGDYAKLVTFMETMITHLWYPCTVATLSRRTRQLLDDAFQKSVDSELHWLLDSRLHDFGFRGCTTLEQSIVGGTAHLLNFRGSDTMSACYYAQFHLNNGKPVAQSIPATEHSVMTSWPSEAEAIRNMIRKFGGQNAVYACVMDSYDYTNALDNILPLIHKEKTEKGGLMVLRPDSGTPVDVVLQGLRAADKVAGHDVNKKGYKVIRGYTVIQGDGVDYNEIKKIANAVLEAGYSAQCVAFGMGGGLLQKVNRDTMSFATKLAYIKYADGREMKIMKRPATESGKKSFPGILKVKRNDKGVPVIYPSDGKVDKDNLLEVVYDKGPVAGHKWRTFDEQREHVEREWAATPRNFDPISAELQAEVTAWLKNFDVHWAERNR